jgi:hypothetical protein
VGPAGHEAAAARRLVVAGPYPVLDEIRALGITVLDPRETAPVADLLTAEDKATKVLDANQDAVRTHLDIRDLPTVLAELADHAQRLAAPPKELSA